MKGYVTDIEKDTIENSYFREVLYTDDNMQLVLMTLRPKEDIGIEKHPVSQFFRIERGIGKVVIDGKEHRVKSGSGIIVPANTKHNIINSGDIPLKLYSIYSPPKHKDKTIHKTKKEAENDKEEFDGKTTE